MEPEVGEGMRGSSRGNEGVEKFERGSLRGGRGRVGSLKIREGMRRKGSEWWVSWYGEGQEGRKIWRNVG